MLSSVTSWWGSQTPETTTETDSNTTDQTVDNPQPAQATEATTGVKEAEEGVQKPGESTQEDKGDDTEKSTDGPSVQEQLDEVSAKAYDAAKEWGSYLYSFGKSATQQVVKTAKVLKDTVEEKTLLGEFSREQEKFVQEKHRHSDTAVPPWIGYNEEETMKKQIFALSEDKRNFMRNPPAGVQFTFDYETSFPVAMAVLQEDANLKNMRFELVPKQISEETFWRNYFYRVSLIKQSAQLSSLAQETDKPAGKSVPSVRTKDDEEPLAGSPTEHEFISDDFPEDQFDQEEMRKDMEQLGMKNDPAFTQEAATSKNQEDIPEWERELQAELQEYEVVGGENTVDDADLEREILQQIEAEAEQ